jgi:uncharacterized protein (DUF2062 family)
VRRDGDVSRFDYMPKKLIKRFTPDHNTVKDHRHLRVFGELLHDPNLWHLNRRSVSGAFFLGLFWAFIPMPLQMLAAAASAIAVRVNLPISVTLVWLTNPLTIPPIFYFNYLVGSWLLGHPMTVTEFEASMEWFESVFSQIWQPLLAGGVLCGLVAGTVGYVGMRAFWRWHVLHHHRRRQASRAARTPSSN